MSSQQKPGQEQPDAAADDSAFTSASAVPQSDYQRANSRSTRPQLPGSDKVWAFAGFAGQPRSRSCSTTGDDTLSPAEADRVFPIRSVVSVEPTPTPAAFSDRSAGGSYFQLPSHARRRSTNAADVLSSQNYSKVRPTSDSSPPGGDRKKPMNRRRSASNSFYAGQQSPLPPRYLQQSLQDVIAETTSVGSERGDRSQPPSERPTSARVPSFKSEDICGLVTARFKHVTTEEGHAIITGRDGETLQRCEDEPIHIPGAVQGFGLLIALEEQSEGRLLVRVVSENSKRLIGYSPKQLFALESFTDILSEEQADNLLDHVDFIRDEDADVVTNGPEVFTITIRTPQRKSQKLWCAMHINDAHENLLICEFEIEDDPMNPLVPPNDATPEPPEDTLNSQPTEEEFQESTRNTSKPLRVLRSARKRKGEAAAMEVFNIMSQVQEQLAAAPNLEKFRKVLVGVVKELTGFHRVMIYQFDQAWNGRVVTELVDPRATKDLYNGLNFPASDIPKQARDLYRINKVRMLYDRDQETARLVCRTIEDLETPLNLTHSYLRAMSPIHLKYLANMAVRSSMSISINAFDELWGLIACHSYGSRGMRVSFPIRKMCRLVGDSASRNIERLSYASRLQARKLINTVPTQKNPSGYIIASSEDLLKLFDADFGLLSIRDETKILGHIERSQEALAMLEYLRMRQVTNVMTSQDIKEDFPDLRYPPGFQIIAGLLLVPLSMGGQDFIVFFRKGHLKEVKWAGNPYEKFIKEGTEGYLEPRKSFRVWSEMVVGKCREWTEEEIETAAVLCLVYGKFIEVWRQKEAALQNSQLTRLLLANSAHEVRTPLNAIINYLEIALEGSLDQETRDNLAKSHSASKSLIYVINDLLDLTKTEEGGELVKDEVFDLRATLSEATDMFRGDAKRKKIEYEVTSLPGLPSNVVGDQRKVRQAISNVTANAIQNTKQGSVKVEMYLVTKEENRCEIEVSFLDTGIGMSPKKLDQLFRELEQVQSEGSDSVSDTVLGDSMALPEPPKHGEKKALGLGLAVVARIIRNMNGQLRLKSEEGKGSRFVMMFPFEVRNPETQQRSIEGESNSGSATPHADPSFGPITPPIEGEVTLVERGSATKKPSADAEHRFVMSRKNSADSMNSKHSVGSFRSVRSNVSFSSMNSGRSEADRLIEAIQEPHQVEGWHENSVKRFGSTEKRLGSSSSAGGLSRTRPQQAENHETSHSRTTSLTRHSQPKSIEVGELPVRAATDNLRLVEQERQCQKPGQSLVTDQGVPIKPVRIPDGVVIYANEAKSLESNAAAASSPSSAAKMSSLAPPSPGHNSADDMRVLVAEDDPVNSRIIQKRLEKLGHHVYLTVNGEDCASVYCERSAFFDVILMDMQMPIVDGLTSTKMIRSFEKTHPSHQLSTRAALNKRVPIIAVSASLVENQCHVYINAGFDGWILKPIAFNRLKEIMNGLVDEEVRSDNLYCTGNWENGGWFDHPVQDASSADTKPSGEPPMNAPGASGPSAPVKAAAANESPFVKEEMESEQSQEQVRLAGEQSRGQDDTSHGLKLGNAELASSEETISADRNLVKSPEPILPDSQPQ